MDNVLSKLDKHGCFINGLSYGSYMYADDLILLAPTLSELQNMVDTCYKEITAIGLELNELKSFYLRFGKGWGDCHTDLKTDRGVIPRVLSGSYLGVDIISGNKLRINFHRQKM